MGLTQPTCRLDAGYGLVNEWVDTLELFVAEFRVKGSLVSSKPSEG